MIECKHKWQYVVTNRGITTFYCTLHQKSVNDEICSNCADCEGETLKPIVPEMAFPKRTDEEVRAIHGICKGCPLMTKDHLCKKMYPENNPVDIVAQHPSNHCPEKLW